MRISDWSSDVCSSDLQGCCWWSSVILAYRSGRCRSFARPIPAKDRRHIYFRHPTERQLRRSADRSDEHTSELQSLMRISYAVFCLNKNTSQIQCINRVPTHVPATYNSVLHKS